MKTRSKRVRRYYYVGTGKSDIVHMTENSWVDGEKTFCGVTMRAGWPYWLGIRNVPKGSSVCARCAAH